MERIVLGTLRWDVAGVTPQDFIPHFLSCLEELMEDSEDATNFMSTFRRHGDTLAAMCVCDSRFLGTRPSLIAAAALNSALRGLEAKRKQEMNHMTCTLATLCRSDLVSGRGLLCVGVKVYFSKSTGYCIRILLTVNQDTRYALQSLIWPQQLQTRTNVDKIGIHWNVE